MKDEALALRANKRARRAHPIRAVSGLSSRDRFCRAGAGRRLMRQDPLLRQPFSNLRLARLFGWPDAHVIEDLVARRFDKRPGSLGDARKLIDGGMGEF